jgi:3-oxoacyl-[acyl-carrier protein] reductase
MAHGAVDLPVILITGTRSGIGRYLAEYYVARPFRVIGVSRGEPDLRAENYRHFRLDVREERAVKEMFSALRATYQRLDILVNNAGVNPSIGPVLLTPLGSLTRAFETNCLGPFLLSREAAKLMSRNSFGRIITFSSMAVRHEVAGEAVYTATKAAVTAFSRVFAKEVYKLGITCNVLAPSAIDTALSQAVDQHALRDVLRRNAIPDYGLLSDISNSIDWLIRPESQAITGQVIFLGGA